MRVIVTRPQEDAEALAGKLAALGHEAVIAPLLRIVPRRGIAIPRRDYAAVAATSANGLRTLAGHEALTWLRQIPSLTVGPQSLAAAQALGFVAARAAGGDAIGLTRHIGATMTPADGPILYISGSATAGDLAASLRAQGFDVDRVVLYEAEPAARLDVDPSLAGGVMLYSPRTARIWTELAGERAAHLMHFCLSSNVAAVLPQSRTIRIAGRPEEDAMLELLGRA